MKSAQERGGFTLLIALGLLVLLSTFALVFARVMMLERTASNAYVDDVKALHAAQAGVARALVELQRIAGRRHYSDPWADHWGYQRTPPPGFALDGRAVDLLLTQDPSFKAVDPEGRTMFGNPLVVSGRLATEGDAIIVYRLKVLDAAGQIDLNHRDSATARRLLASLLRAAVSLPVAQADAMAQQVLASRPRTGFQSESSVLAILREAGLNEADAKLVGDMVTVHAWVDPSVIRPWNLDRAPERELRLMPRAPVNLNTAPEPVLTALFAGLEAESALGTFTIDYDSAARLAAEVVQRRGAPPFGTVPFAPFRTWPELEEFIDDLPSSVFASASWTPPAAQGGVDPAPAGGLYRQLIEGLRVGHRDLVKAALNPNPILTKLGPAPNHGGYQGTIPRLVDKSDLTVHTTEGCFDAMGVFEITSLGLVLKPDGKGGGDQQVVAARTRHLVSEVYRPFRLTTQEDFEAHRGFMIPGDFIPTADASWSYPGIDGLNKPTYFDRADMPLPGWPGVVSWPNYSLVRASSPDRRLRAPHQPAAFEGYLTLTNLIGTKTADPDFNAGFSRGRLEAIKGRAWYDLKDETPGGAYRRPKPTHPSGPAELARLTAPLTGVDDAAPNGTASPRRRQASDPARAAVVDEDPGDTSGSPGPAMFAGGSSLLNTGVIVSPERTNAAGQPQFLAYDGDNLDLTRGCSIRFWVQPLRDPFAQEREVLLSFVGSRDGSRRQAGFRIYKETLPTGVVNIVLEAVGGTEPEASGLPVNWNWATAANGTAPRIEVPVTPAAPYVNDPLAPQWIPHTWHWVVVNIGPGKLAFDDVTQFFATLQVDKRKAENILFYKGNMDGPNRIHEYGELHGHVVGTNSQYEPLTPATINKPNAQGWIAPRQLGDFYHCQEGRSTFVVTKTKEYGGPGQPPAVVFMGDPVPFFPWIRPGDTPGQYVPGPSWPAPLPFPILSHDHQMRLRFYDLSGGSPQLMGTIPMVRDGTTGIWSLNFPAARSTEIFGPDPDVDRPAFTAPDGSVVSATTVTGGYPGDAEWHISVEAQWNETHYTDGCPLCNADTSIPADRTQLPAVEDDPYNPHFGEPLPYSHHNSGPTFKGGMPYTTSPFTGFRSWVRTAQPLPHPQGREPFFPAGPPFGQFPLTYIDDDCHGCESCDVDGPVFIGGEPAGPANYAGGTTPAPVDPATMASAVFDNVVFINGDLARRTDWPGSSRTGSATDPITGQPVVYADRAKDFEDRFYEFNLSSSLEGGSAFDGFGAVYHRALLDLRGRGRLGTLTWTAYPGTGLAFEAAVWRHRSSGATGTTALWRYGGSSPIDPGDPDHGYTDDAAAGITFTGPGDPPVGLSGSSAAFDGRGDPQPAETLVFGLRLRDLAAGRGEGQALPAPIVQTPVFEDLTLTLVHERPLVLHAEGGVEE